MKRAKTAAFILTGILVLLAVSTLPGASPAMAQNYIIQAGDTLFSIGQKFGVAVEDIIKANSLKSDMIYRLRIPPESRGDALDTRYVLGFCVGREYNLPGSHDSLAAYGSQISAVAPFWYRLAPDGPALVQEHQTADGSYTGDMETVISEAYRHGISVLALVHNMVYPGQVDGARLAEAVLENEKTRGEFINQLESIIKEYGCDGVNLDIEKVNLDDRERFSLLVKELFERLDPQGYKVTVCVPAKTHDNLSSSWSGPFDYMAIGRYSHSVIIMTYDEHGYHSGPGPIASSGWVREVAKYAVENIPAEKVLLGIPGYGFDWTAGQARPRYISFAQAVAAAESMQVDVLWDNAVHSPFFKYSDGCSEHEVWFENAVSFKHKLDIVQEFNLRGIAIWRLGMEDPGLWDILHDRVKTEKEARSNL